jgi:hypothetical protein
MSLNSYNTASFVREGMANSEVYARVISGPRAGTVARIVDIRQKYYSAHDYRLSVKGRRRFWVSGGDLERVSNPTGETVYVRDNTAPTHEDMMGRTIAVGQVLLFARKPSSTGKVEMVIGTVHSVSDTGVVYVRIFKGSKGDTASGSLVRVAKPVESMIMDRNTPDQVMLSKLQAW